MAVAPVDDPQHAATGADAGVVRVRAGHADVRRHEREGLPSSLALFPPLPSVTTLRWTHNCSLFPVLPSLDHDQPSMAPLMHASCILLLKLTLQVDQLSLSFQTLSRVTSTPMPFIYAHFIKVRHCRVSILTCFRFSLRFT